jgi:hypothetical protein
VAAAIPTARLPARLPAPPAKRKRQVIFGLSLIVALAVFAMTKPVGLGWEIVWICHIATAAMALGCLANQRVMIAAGLLFHLSMGFVFFLLDAKATGSLPLPSVVIHIAPVVIGLIEVRSANIAKTAIVVIGVMMLFALGLARLVTPPALNVNLAFSIWPTFSWMPNLAVQSVAGIAFACVTGSVARLVVNRWWVKA